MSRKTQHKANRKAQTQSSSPSRSSLMLALVALAVVAAGALLLLSGGLNSAPGTAVAAANNAPAAEISTESLMTERPQLLSPQNYMSTFAENSEVDYVLVDVRTREEFASGHIAGAVNIPLDQISARLSEFPTDKPIVLYCRSGNRSDQAAAILNNAGYQGIYDLGGVINWTAQGYPLQ